MFDRSYRRLLFFESELNITSNSTHHVPNKQQILQLTYITNIRPSLLLNYLISCAPNQLLYPYELQAMNSQNTITQTQYIDLLVSFNFNDLNDFKNDLNNKNILQNYWKTNKIELEIWNLIKISLDMYLQRLNTLSSDMKSVNKEWYDLISELGYHYFGK